MKHWTKLLCAVLTVSLLLLTLLVPASAATFENEEEVFEYLTTEMNLNNAAACGVMANIDQESGFRPTAGTWSSYGLCQWSGTRADALRSYCSRNGYNVDTVQGQMHFLQYDLEHDDTTGTLNYLRSVPNTDQGAYDAAYYFCYNFERPSNKASRSAYRGDLARNTYWPEYGGRAPKQAETLVPDANGNWYAYLGDTFLSDYIGFITNAAGTWRVEYGKVIFGITSVLNGIAKGIDGWWYVENGKINYNFTGIRANQAGSWRIEKGKVNFGCNEVVWDGAEWRYCRNGKVDYNYSGVAPNAAGWWRMENGKVNFGYHGLAPNDAGWWYLKNGKVDFGFTGLCTNFAGTWYVRDGKVRFDRSGTYRINGRTVQLSGGKVVG